MAVDAARFLSGVPATVAPARDVGAAGPDHEPPEQNHPGPHERHLPDWYTAGVPDHHRRPPPSRQETSSIPVSPCLRGGAIRPLRGGPAARHAEHVQETMALRRRVRPVNE